MPPANATARASIRILAPGIVVSADCCAGEPRVFGMPTPTPTVLPGEFATYAAFTARFPDTTVSHEAYIAARAFEAGRAWEREQRAERKRRRLAKRWRAGQQAADGRVDDRG